MKGHKPKNHVGSELVSECPHSHTPETSHIWLVQVWPWVGQQQWWVVNFAGPLLVEKEARRASDGTDL